MATVDPKSWTRSWAAFLDLETSTDHDSTANRLGEARRCAEAVAALPRLPVDAQTALDAIAAFLQDCLRKRDKSLQVPQLAATLALARLTHGPWEKAVPLVAVAETTAVKDALTEQASTLLRLRLGNLAAAADNAWHQRSPLHFAANAGLAAALVDDWSLALQDVAVSGEPTDFFRQQRPGSTYAEPRLRFRLPAYLIFFGRPELVSRLSGPEQIRKSYLPLNELNTAEHELFLLSREIFELAGESDTATATLRIGTLLEQARSQLSLEGEVLAVGCAFQLAKLMKLSGIGATALNEWRLLSHKLTKGATEDLWALAGRQADDGGDKGRKRSFGRAASRAALSMGAWRLRELFSHHGTQTARQDRMLAEVAQILHQDLPLSTFLLQKLDQVGMNPESFITNEIMPKGTAVAMLKHQHAPTPVREVRQTLIDSLGAERAAQVTKVSTLPLGVGSISTVHAATHADGSELALKIRHDAVRAAIQQDAKQIDSVRWILELIAPKLPWKKIIGVWRDLLLAECDFIAEARHHQIIYDYVVAAKLPHVRVPKLIHELSSERLLTMERAPGLVFEEFLVSSTQKQRNQAAYTIVEYQLALATQGIYVYDIHPGNFIFEVAPRTAAGEDGEVTVWFLDFASKIDDPTRTYSSLTTFLYYMAQEDNTDAIYCLKACGFYGKNSDWQAIWLSFRQLYLLPFLHDGEFEITLDFARRVITQQIAREYGGSEFLLPADFRLTNIRMYWSLYSLLGKMRAKANWGELARRYGQPAPADVWAELKRSNP